MVCLSLNFIISCGKPIQETKPIRKDITETVFAPGILEAKDTYKLTAQTEGYIKNLNFHEGDIIEPGHILAEINNNENLYNSQNAKDLWLLSIENLDPKSPALQQANISIQNSKLKLIEDSILYEKNEILMKNNSISKIELEKSLFEFNVSKLNYLKAIENYNQLKQQAEQQLFINKTQKDISSEKFSFNQIKTIVGGKVYSKHKEAGDYVKKGDVIATIGNSSEIYAKVSIDENSINKVKLGQKVIIQLNTNRNRNYNGVVSEILPSFDVSTQSFTCKITFIDSLDFNLINTQLQCNIIVASYKSSLVIPRNYLYYANTVRVKGNENPVNVTTRIISTDWVEITSGIDENMTLITDNIK